MFNLQPLLWNGAPTQFLTFVSSNATITPSITLSGDGPCQWEVTEANGAKYYYNANSFSRTRSVAGNMTVRLLNTMQVAPYATVIDVNSDGIVSNVDLLRLELFPGLTALYLHNNQFTGDWTSKTLPAGLLTLQLGANQFTGDWTSKTLPAGLTALYLYGNQFTGDWTSKTLPAGLVTLDLFNNQFTGDWTSKTLPAGLVTLYLHINRFTGFPAVPNPSVLVNAQLYSQGATNMTQARVDAFVLAWYTSWEAGAFSANCIVHIGGTNADPSGVYQNPAPNPPATAKEMIYVMVNDPFATGNKVQSWTY